MLLLAKRTLNLTYSHERLLLRTRSLNICAGHAVTLNRDTWTMLMGLVGEISVSLIVGTVLVEGEIRGACALPVSAMSSARY